ncbi:MAG: bifunctional 4-hydroxy-2-oxoglutarate aldolase/2-dehydro-3-deoxy-phosphogluconate aldolase [Flavobacteriia bacterium]|jgi:2-dehydro-3-deoxyphosphogluconate aldolase/(4S)-4-hydroxy-2-oxoglutarate aldolase
MSTQNNIRQVLSQHPVIPVVTFNNLNEVEPMVERLVKQNIRCIEITLRTDVAFDAIQKTKEEFGKEISVGMGTIVNTFQIDKAVEIGIDFMVSPGISPALFSAFEASKIAFIPGVSTPSEIILGLQQNWDTFKFFPAHLFGGLEALKTYGQVFPHVKFCPTGGISEATHQEYLALGNIISVGGSWMTK